MSPLYISVFQIPPRDFLDQSIANQSFYHNHITPSSENLLINRGSLYFLATAKNIQSVVENRDFWPRLKADISSRYFNTSEGSAFNTLKKTGETIFEEYSDKISSFELVVAAYVDGIFYCCAGGGSGVSLLRGGSMSHILTSSAQTITASGVPKSEDSILLWNSSIKNVLFKTDFLRFHEPENLVSTIFAQVSQTPSNILSAAYICFFSEKEVSTSIHTVENTLVNMPSKRNTLLDLIRSKMNGGRIRIKDPRMVELKDIRSRKLAKLGAILGIFLIVFIVIGLRRKSINEYRNQYTTQLTEAREKLQKAQEIFTTDPARSRDLFKESKDLIAKLQSENIKDEGLSELSNLILITEKEILGEYTLNFSEYFDVILISEGFTIQKYTYDDGNIFFSSPHDSRIIRFTLASKRSEIFTPSVEKIYDITTSGKMTYFLHASGIGRVGDTNTTLISDQFEEGDLIETFSENIYTFSRKDSKIYKYSGNGLEEKNVWLKEGQIINSSEMKDWMIDGSVWIISNQDIQKFIQGRRDSFQINGFSSEISELTVLFTTPESEYLYTLEPHQKRIIVVSKNGNYQSQYRGDVFAEAIGFIVDEETREVFVFTKTKIYKARIE